MIPADKFFFGHPPIDAEKTSFFARIRLPNGTFKTTAADRLKDVDSQIAKILSESRNSTHMNVLDIGISSGITSYDLVEILQTHSIEATLTGVDQFICGNIVRISAFFSVLSDSRGDPLQFIILQHGVKNFSAKRDILTGYFLFFLALKCFFRIFLLRKYKKMLLNSGNKDVTPVMLLDPTATVDSRFTFIEDDMFTLNHVKGTFDVVRAANILNLGYFSESDLIRAGEKISEKLKVGGLLVICRTDSSGQNHGSIYLKKNERTFKLEKSVGNGSEINHLVPRFLEETLTENP